MSLQLFPLAEAVLPAHQMKDLRRLEASIRNTLHTLKQEEKHLRVVLLVALSSSLYFVWNPLSRAYACILTCDVWGSIRELFPVVLAAVCLVLLLRHPALYEKIYETQIYVQRLNSSLRQLHLFFDKTSLTLFIYQNSLEGSRRVSSTSTTDVASVSFSSLSAFPLSSSSSSASSISIS